MRKAKPPVVNYLCATFGMDRSRKHPFTSSFHDHVYVPLSGKHNNWHRDVEHTFFEESMWEEDTLSWTVYQHIFTERSVVRLAQRNPFVRSLGTNSTGPR